MVFTGRTSFDVPVIKAPSKPPISSSLMILFSISIPLSSQRLITLLLVTPNKTEESGENDLRMYEWIKSSGFTGYIIATKADKLSRSQQTKSINVIKRAMKIKDEGLIFPFSSTSRQGVEEVWKLVEGMLNLQD
jgi:GTP-binding protein